MVRFRRRVVEGLRWRAESLYERVPRHARVRIDNAIANWRVRRGITSFERARLVRTYTECLRLLLEREAPETLGDYVEFGVYHGTSLSCMYEAKTALGLKEMRLFGFDSFEGFPTSASTEDAGVWAPGQCRSSIDLTVRNLRRWNTPLEAVTLIKGWFSQTATPETRQRYGLTRASVVMIDCDLYSSTCQALAFCAPLLGRTTVFVFDDWNACGLADRNMGEARAFAEFLEANPQLAARRLEGLNYKDKADPEILLVTRP